MSQRVYIVTCCGEKGLDEGTIEYRKRTDVENQDMPLDRITEFIKSQLR